MRNWSLDITYHITTNNNINIPSSVVLRCESQIMIQMIVVGIMITISL